MAKRSKPAKKAPAKKKASKPAKKVKAPKRRPKNQPLPGMEDAVIKDRVLDSICSRIHDYREASNEARAGEDQDKARAMPRMKDLGIESYKAHGIELIHTTTDKLRVRMVDDDTGDDDDVPGTDSDAGDVLAEGGGDSEAGEEA